MSERPQYLIPQNFFEFRLLLKILEILKYNTPPAYSSSPKADKPSHQDHKKIINTSRATGMNFASLLKRVAHFLCHVFVWYSTLKEL